MSAQPLEAPDSLELLRAGELAIEGRLVAASNTTLYARLRLGRLEAGCVYKPVAGERPLWDFPDGTLAGREVSTYLVSEATGWRCVPPTLLRDGPLGAGMCQLWVEAEATELVDVVPVGGVEPGWLPVLTAEDRVGRPVELVHADDVRLRRLAVLDVVVNNGDRKGGHVLVTGERVYGVDHGVAFSVEEKLRTVLWGWAGSPLRPDEVSVLDTLREQLAGVLGDALREHLTAAEVVATRRRVDRLLRRGRLPEPSLGWPSIPWPPF